MTNITVTFTSNSTINILNETGSEITVNLKTIESDGTLTDLVDLIIANDASTNYVFAVDGIYKVTHSSEAITVIIADKIILALQDDVKEILLSDDVNKILPKGYDFVSLVLLSIMFIGNNPYQLATYDTNNNALYTVISEAIENCSKYLDRQENTVQSTNKIWQ